MASELLQAKQMNDPIGDPLQVLLVSANAAVRDEIIESLRGAWMEAASTDHIDGCISRIPSGTGLVLLHPDGFRFDQVVGILFALRRERPDVLVVLVTEKPERFAKLVRVAENARPPTIIPLPASARTILEAIAFAAAAAHAWRRPCRVASEAGQAD